MREREDAKLSHQAGSAGLPRFVHGEITVIAPDAVDRSVLVPRIRHNRHRRATSTEVAHDRREPDAVEHTPVERIK